MADGSAASQVWELRELLDLYDVEPVGEGRFRAATLPARIRPEDALRNVVEGSLILGQALVAARRAEGDRFVQSAHMLFARAARVDAPLELGVERVHAGRSFSSVVVTAEQGGRRCAQGLFQLDTDEPDCIRHAAPMPAVADPDASTPYDLPLVGREVRLAGGADFADPEKVGPPNLDVWVRYAHPPGDAELRQALLAEPCGPFTIGTSMRPHAGYGQAQAHQTLSTGVLSLTIRFHAASALDDWLLYAHESVHAGRGLCDGQGRIFERSGRLVATFQQTGLLRPLPAATAGRTPRRDVL